MDTIRIDIVLPSYAKQAIATLELAGFEAWCVGGCVRDGLLNRQVNDYDIATNASWQDAERTFAASGYNVHRTGIKHGTITVARDGAAMEVTTYRTDGAYSDGRHPDEVAFVGDIREDLARRDFTMNALAYHPQRGLLDCWGGLDDIKHKVIRVVGDASKRFSEDGLRILRACRFASQLGFSIEPVTLQTMKSHKMRLLKISAERITHELQEMLLGNFVHDALLSCADVLGPVLPEIVAMKNFQQHTPYHIYDVLEHTAWVVQRSPATPLSRWAALFHDIGKPGAFFMDGDRGHFYGHPRLSAILARGIMRRLRLAPALESDILTLVRLHDKVIQPTTKAVRKALAQMNGNTELFRALCALKRADALSQSQLSEPRVKLAGNLELVLDDLIAQSAAFTVKQLAITGKDVIALGVPAGPRVGTVLQAAFEAVLDERIANEREQLIAFVEQECLLHS